MLVDTSGIVRPSGYLDYESLKTKYYILNISATDDGHPKFTSYCRLKIDVTDFNDNKPRFNSSSYVTSISEDAPVGTNITTIKAADIDSGINAQVYATNSLINKLITMVQCILNVINNVFQIKYTLSGEYLDSFDMVSNTGQVRLKKPIDRETRSEYMVIITATDHGTPSLSSSTNLIIQVRDINDNPPIFTSRVYKRTISEGVAIGTIIMTVEANDADNGVNGQIEYEIIHGNDLGLFTIDGASGTIRLVKSLNRETNATIKVIVIAKDQGNKQLSDQAEVLLVLTDVNDNAPTIQPKKMVAFVSEVSIYCT